jgi:hypothetical protein
MSCWLTEEGGKRSQQRTCLGLPDPNRLPQRMVPAMETAKGSALKQKMHMDRSAECAAVSVRPNTPACKHVI